MKPDELMQRILEDSRRAQEQNREAMGMYITRQEYNDLRVYMKDLSALMPNEPGDRIAIYGVRIRVVP